MQFFDTVMYPGTGIVTPLQPPPEFDRNHMLRDAVCEYVINRVGPRGLDSSDEDTEELAKEYVAKRYALMDDKFKKQKIVYVVISIKLARNFIKGL